MVTRYSMTGGLLALRKVADKLVCPVPRYGQSYRSRGDVPGRVARRARSAAYPSAIRTTRLLVEPLRLGLPPFATAHPLRHYPRQLPRRGGADQGCGQEHAEAYRCAMRCSAQPTRTGRLNPARQRGSAGAAGNARRAPNQAAGERHVCGPRPILRPATYPIRCAEASDRTSRARCLRSRCTCAAPR